MKNKIFVDASAITYLLLQSPESIAEKLNELFKQLSLSAKFFTNVLVIDEVLYVLNKKYAIPYEEIMEEMDLLLEVIDILPLERKECAKLQEILRTCKLLPSDALHVANMLNNKINKILSEDSDFDKVKGIKRIWIE